MDIEEKISKLTQKQKSLVDRLKLHLKHKSMVLNTENPDELVMIDIQIAGLHRHIEKKSIKLLELQYSKKTHDLQENLKNSKQAISQNFNNLKATLKKNLNCPKINEDLSKINELNQQYSPKKTLLLPRPALNSPEISVRLPNSRRKDSEKVHYNSFNFKRSLKNDLLRSEKSSPKDSESPSISLQKHIREFRKLNRDENLTIELKLKQHSEEKKKLKKSFAKTIFEYRKKKIFERKEYLNECLKYKSINRTVSRPKSHIFTENTISGLFSSPFNFKVKMKK